MCLPALTLASGLFSAAGSIMQGRAQAKVYEAQARVAQQNARLATLQGIEELKKGAREEGKFRKKARQFQSSQRTRLAASGIQLGGSSASVLADTASGIEQDATAIRFNTLQSKYARDVQAMNFRNEANAARANAKNAKMSGVLGGIGSLFNTGMTYAGITAGVPTGTQVNGGSITVHGSNSSWWRQTGQYSSNGYKNWSRVNSNPWNNYTDQFALGNYYKDLDYMIY